MSYLRHVCDLGVTQILPPRHWPLHADCRAEVMEAGRVVGTGGIRDIIHGI